MDERTQKTLFTGDGADSWTDAAEARDKGRDLRDYIPHEAHTYFTAQTDRPTVRDYMEATNEGRDEHLLPIRIERMRQSPFAFFRGTAGLMAYDLSHEPVTGLHAQLCGDAHASNFGLFGGRLGSIVIDVNDFDETVRGPWEWDVKRLAASLILAGRQNDIDDGTCVRAARHAARAYRRAARRVSATPFLDAWRNFADESVISRTKADALADDYARALRKAARNTSERVADRWTARDDGQWEFTEDPPIRTRISPEDETDVVDALRRYTATLPPAKRPLSARYRAHDVVHRIVGTGSVGLRSYLVLLQGNGNEALVLQLKQAQRSLLAPYVPETAPTHNGQRIVEGIRIMQADSDSWLGWTNIGEREYMVRQFRNHKADIDPARLTAKNLDDYGRLTGALLARAHCRTVDSRTLWAYLARGKHFDRAIAAYATSYAAQVEADYAEFLALVDDGELPVNNA
ncbi:DUF2252 domain-containing protein [Hoyosella altamirensis]|uniref:Uncharacterized protein (DUF2252 family) n=1 Tax=Hoyosella altamirensis TaxID=616997 RepID=A0A839RIV7_9ACTN|nr:DUF2252 domain-containing protein [Hoyosella altamirensis]MBB3036327.1 uncharacterized protein (DUF2252 family) [Hoyosella altamirensis]